MNDAGRDHTDFTVETYNIRSLKELSRSGNEIRYNCPFCEEKRGKADTDGKFFFNAVKQKGYCFKCHSSVYPEGAERGDRPDPDEIEWKKSLDAILRFYPDTIFNDIEFPKEVHFEFPELTRDLLVYLKERNPFLIPLKDCLGLKGWKGRDTGVVIPFLYRNKICKFQCRFVTRKGQPLDKNDTMKYYTSPGPKPLYSPFHIFADFRSVGKTEELTICEGVFDAIALAIMGFPNPVAILGDKLTPLQMWDIRHIKNSLITKIYLCLDDVKRSEHTERLVRKFIPCVTETEISASWAPGEDPEEFLRARIKTDKKFREDCIERVIQWVQSFKGEMDEK